MDEQRYFEDTELGESIGRLEFMPNKRLAIKFAGAARDFYEIHYDKDFAIAAGQPDVIVHGAQKASISAQLLTNWMGMHGILRKVSCSFRGIDFFDVMLTCEGKVVDKYMEGDECRVSCEVWIDNAKGERTTVGGGVVALPSRS